MAACIFCGGRPVTKEHTWAQWLRQYVDMHDETHSEEYVAIYPDNMEPAPRRRRSGDVRRRGVRCVCGNCNNTWMSALQEENKPTLIPLVTGAPILISAESQIAIATWVACFVMCSEYRAPERVTVGKIARTLLWRKRVPPPTWAIWIANHQPESGKRPFLQHISLALSDDFAHGTPIDGKSYNFNAQVTTFTIGKLLVVAMGSDYHQNFPYQSLKTGSGSPFLRIWPLATETLYWGPPNPVSAFEAASVGDFCMRRFHHRA